MIKLMKRILNISGQYRGRIVAAFFTAFLKSMFGKAPLMLSYVALAAFYNGTCSKGLCLRLGVGMAVCLILQIIFQHATDRLQSAAGFMIFSDMRLKLGEHLRRMPMGYFTEGNIGKISSVLSSDMVFIEENCMTAFADMMSYIFAQVIMIAFLLFFNVRLGLAAALIALVIILISQGMRRDSLAKSVIRQEQNEALTGSVLDFVEGIGIAKTYNLLGERSESLTENFRASCRTSIDFERSQMGWQMVLYTAYGLGAALLAWLALDLNSKAMMDTTAVIGIMLFVFDVFGPLKALYSQSARLTVMNSCMDRIEEVFAEKELPNDGTEMIPESSGQPEFEFRDVRFGYGEKEVLHGVSFRAEKNTMTALVGPSGSGKSTVANLLARFWDVQSGQVLVRGADVRNVPLRELMARISMVFQRVYLFQDTIYNNIVIGRPEATKEEVIEAAKKARCYDFIMALPDGFDTVVGEGGASLSGGEKQRISIARCILKDAPIVILDEATANVDADNESYIQEAISELCRGKTLLVIAHRLNTIRSADRILVIDEGSVAQSGTHDELIAQEGIYRDFVTARTKSAGWNRRKGA
ncbi:MAG: ABC transporter ATP-binding protein/permease [Clostridia bacterium]|nr:ABC transporter ATP-binding protein/permease [Clostridia bacterium]